jgi:3-dehydroquinate dehydratase/shikimate dehydrogenase
MILKTERLLLRQWRQEDFEPFAKMNADPRVREHFAATLSREESNASAQLFFDLIEKNGYGLWAVTVPGVADFIGFIGLHPVSCETHFTPAIEIGWRLAEEFWGKGYATEGAKEALRFAFETIQLNEVVAYTVLANKRSRAVMEKLGMTYNPEDDFDHPTLPEGHPKRRHALYRITKEQYNDKYKKV